MILWLYGDSAYLVVDEVRIHIAGYFFLSESPDDPLQMKHMHNSEVYVEFRILKHVVASAEEVECGALFYNAQLALPIKVILEELGNIQTTTSFITDNSTAAEFTNK